MVKKRCCCVALAMCMVVLSACKEADNLPPSSVVEPPSSSVAEPQLSSSLEQPSKPENPYSGLTRRRGTMFTETQQTLRKGILSLRAEIDGYTGEGGLYIRWDDELCKAVGRLLAQSPRMEAIKEHWVDLDAGSGRIEITADNDMHWEINLRQLSAEESPLGAPATIVRMAMGSPWITESYKHMQYLFMPEVYDEMLALLLANSCTENIVFDGDYVRLGAGSGAYYRYYEFGDRILSIETIHQTSFVGESVYLYDAATGERLWCEVFLDGYRIRALPCDYNGFDVKLVKDNGEILFIDSQNPDRQESVRVPQALQDHLSLEQPHNMYFWQTDLHVESGVSVASVYQHGMLIDTPDGLVRFTEEDIPFEKTSDTDRLMYAEVRVLNDGRTVVARIDKLHSQDIMQGILLYDVPTGQARWYTDMFHFSTANVIYLNDTIVLAKGFEENFVFDLTAYTQTRVPQQHWFGEYDDGFSRWASADASTYVFLKNEEQPDGGYRGVLHAGNPGNPLLVIEGKAPTSIVGITEHYVYVRAFSPDNMVVQVKYR